MEQYEMWAIYEINECMILMIADSVERGSKLDWQV